MPLCNWDRHAYAMRSVHCGSHAHRTIANACSCAAGSHCWSDRLAEILCSTLAGLLCLDCCPPCFCLLFFTTKAKQIHAVVLFFLFTIPSQPIQQWSNAALSRVTGMFTIISSLAIIEKVSPAKAEKLVRWFDPAILWIQRWLGAFYVPALAVLPLTIQGIEGASVHKACYN